MVKYPLKCTVNRACLLYTSVRDETKILGGMGICGRVLCCHSFLSEFAPVSIKMAKEQNLSLNPTKISGICGRLMCCLKNEEEAYEEDVYKRQRQCGSFRRYSRQEHSNIRNN